MKQNDIYDTSVLKYSFGDALGMSLMMFRGRMRTMRQIRRTWS